MIYTSGRVAWEGSRSAGHGSCPRQCYFAVDDALGVQGWPAHYTHAITEAPRCSWSSASKKIAVSSTALILVHLCLFKKDKGEEKSENCEFLIPASCRHHKKNLLASCGCSIIQVSAMEGDKWCWLRECNPRESCDHFTTKMIGQQDVAGLWGSHSERTSCMWGY